MSLGQVSELVPPPPLLLLGAGLGGSWCCLEQLGALACCAAVRLS